MSFIVIEYETRRPDGPRCETGAHQPLRQDGHYLHRADAEGVAAFWRENPLSQTSVVSVAEIMRMEEQDI